MIAIWLSQIAIKQSGHAGERARLSQMRPDNDGAEEVSPFADYLSRYEREHGRKSKELFKLQDLINSLKWKSSTTMDLKSKDGQGREVVRGRAKARYEANRVFSVSEVRALKADSLEMLSTHREKSRRGTGIFFHPIQPMSAYRGS